MAAHDEQNEPVPRWPAPPVATPFDPPLPPVTAIASPPSPTSTELGSTVEVLPATGDLIADEPIDVSGVDASHSQDRATDDRGIPDPVRSLLDADATAVIVISPDGSVEHVNAAMLTLLGAADIDEIVPGSTAFGVLRSFVDHLPQELVEHVDGDWHGDIDHRATDGTTRLLRATATVAHGPAPAGDATGTISLLLHDVTDARTMLARLTHRAAHDPLTGLANRNRILTELAAAIRRQRSRGGHVSVIFIDLDHLKYVNDAFGHRIGDRLITSSAERLTQATRPRDLVARIGGDEFVVVSADIDDAITALDLAERARRALTGHLRIGELDLDFSVSIGLALTDPDVLDLDDDAAAALLIGNADTAMYQSKQNGRGRCTLFTSQMRTAARERTETAAALAHSIANSDLGVDYQPMFSTVSKAAVGAEALVRWRHPRLGRMDPTTFVSIAEESGLIGQLGEHVLDRALSDLGGWIAAGRVGEDFTVHVNVSRVQLGSSSFVNLVMAKLGEHELRPGQLVLEARETSLMGRVADVDRSIRALRRFGVQIAVDNFGSGPKALSVMTEVGADILKLDGSLTLPAGSSDSETRLVRAVVLLAHALDMRVVAERVSGLDQLHRLRAAGCDIVQGNLLATDAPATDLELFAAIDW